LPTDLIILRQIPEIARRAGERRPERERADATFRARKPWRAERQTASKKARQTIRKLTREPPIRKNNVTRNT